MSQGRKPYEPHLNGPQVHDRRASDINRGTRSHIVEVEVDDPYEAGARISAVRSVRDDPLADQHARGHIDEAQFLAGRQFQKDFETAGRGPRAIALSEAVDGSPQQETLTDAQLKAGKALSRCYGALGKDGSILAHDMLISSMTRVGPATFHPGEDVYLALDLSSVVDLTALVMGSAGEKTRIKAFMWKPEDHLRDHGNRDFGSASDRYTEWMRQGHLLASPGRSISKAIVARQVIELCQTYNVLGMAHDRWGMEDLLRVFDDLQFETWEDRDTEKQGSGLRVVPWGQGYTSMGPAVSALEREVVERTLEHPNNPALNWNIANAVVRMDPAGNRKIDKDKARFRIDGAVALAMLCGLKSKDRKSVVDVAGMIG